MITTWVKLSRDILSWEWYHDDTCKVLLLHLILRANWQEKYFGNDVLVKAGELITSQQHLSAELGKTRQQIRTALKKLESSKTITVTSTKDYTHIKLNKYYITENNSLDYNQQNNQPTTHNQPINNQPTTPTKEYNNINNTNNLNNINKNNNFFSYGYNQSNYDKEVKKYFTGTEELVEKLQHKLK